MTVMDIILTYLRQIERCETVEQARMEAALAIKVIEKDRKK